MEGRKDIFIYQCTHSFLFIYKALDIHMVKDHLYRDKTGSIMRERRKFLFKGWKEMFYLTTHSTHFIYGYMASDIW